MKGTRASWKMGIVIVRASEKMGIVIIVIASLKTKILSRRVSLKTARIVKIALLFKQVELVGTQSEKVIFYLLLLGTKYSTNQHYYYGAK